ncbi:hypothetical protein K490DRAFT_64458 [Saccharata proteae CBS 121410]|uniref:Uncharacterized protein n=1 Tax=Saccharata proteae CBS 121410 TaxID=1314787 RepID=A0A9P4HXV5_9PEZI|nr:hypothetical protein K490DRAFT_64458 [Saccharata proteae CBS 121410]
MPPVRPHLSVTLPKSFHFHYTEGQAPRTPEPEPREELTEPPAIPRATYRVRRRRQALPAYASSNPFEASQDQPIPTIETPTASEPSECLKDPPADPSGDHLLPDSAFKRLISPPRTPLAQISMDPMKHLRNSWSEASVQHRTESTSRPTSSCSGISDSSLSSRDSFNSYHSYGGSCTSPESEFADPFMFPTSKPGQSKVQSSPLQDYNQRPSKRLRTTQETVWTKHMDSHLWLTYMACLQDPTVTPFKMLPGTVPPLGICTRVARQAKKTWRGPSSLPGSKDPDRNDSPDTIKARSGSCTPTTRGVHRPYPKWPKSEATARGRLRKLCKREPMLAAHYQRLLHCRTPSPFPSSPRSSSRSGSSRIISPFRAPNHQSKFSTRDLNISLTTSTSSTMQHGNPLSQLANDQTPQPMNGDIFGQPTARVHQKSQSLQSGLGIGGISPRPVSHGSLGSPFVSSIQHGLTPAHTSEQEAATAFAPILDPPVELRAPKPITRSFKRRAHELLSAERFDTETNFIQELFGPAAEFSHRRVRSRGFSLGDMGAGARMSAIFTPPSSFDQSPSMPQLAPAPENHTHLAPAATADPTIRLGSPFGGHSSNLRFNHTFPRNFSPRTFQPSSSFEERFGSSGE